MINNKKGMSGIVVTLITVLLSIVAIGIVWMVVSGIISQSSSGAEYTAKCLNAGLQITSVTAGVAGHTNVAVTRVPGAQGVEFKGIQFIPDGGTGIDVVGNLLSSKTYDLTTAVPTKMEARAYFADTEDPNAPDHYCDNVAVGNPTA